MTLLEKLEHAMAARRAELIHMPLQRIWGELAIVARQTCVEWQNENGYISVED